MSDKRRPPAFQDIQTPPVYLTGIALRRGFLTGPADTPEEQRLAALIANAGAGSANEGSGVQSAATRFFRRWRTR